jgi:small subunit ribosomal protein S6
LADNLYEAMFVVDAAHGGAEFQEIIRHIANILTNAGAQIERIEKWDERKLAYRIGRAKRGIYILCFFHAPGAAVSQIRHDVQLSEQLLRVLVLRADEIPPIEGEPFSPEGQPVEESAGIEPAPEEHQDEQAEAPEPEPDEADAEEPEEVAEEQA